MNKNAIESLPIKFDVESGSINTFNEVLLDRCKAQGWDHPDADILTIPVGSGNKNLIKSF